MFIFLGFLYIISPTSDEKVVSYFYENEEVKFLKYKVDMRKVFNPHLKLGEKDISQVVIDITSRDDIPQILLGLQHLYNDKEIIKEIFALLERIVPASVDKNNGRPGMPLWRVFVFGMLRLGLNCDYDRLQELANNHSTLREMLGNNPFDDDKYSVKTIRNNIALFTPEILQEINAIIVKAGHKIVKKKIKIQL